MVRFLLLSLVFALSLASTLVSAEECRFGYSYYDPLRSKVILPCLQVGGAEGNCYYVEIEVRPNGDLVLNKVVDLNYQPNFEEDSISSFYSPDFNFVHIPELRIGDPQGLEGGPYEVFLDLYEEGGEIKFRVSSIKAIPPTTYCLEAYNEKAALIAIHIAGTVVKTWCLDFSGSKEFVDAWINTIKKMEQMSSEDLQVEILYPSHCPSALGACFWNELNTSGPAYLNSVFVYVYDPYDIPFVEQVCPSFDWHDPNVSVGILFFGFPTQL